MHATRWGRRAFAFAKWDGRYAGVPATSDSSTTEEQKRRRFLTCGASCGAFRTTVGISEGRLTLIIIGCALAAAAIMIAIILVATRR